MTKHSSLKKRIRARMKKTGERYSTARAMILGSSEGGAKQPSYPGVLEGYGPLGGIQSDTAILGRVLAHARVHHPHTDAPYTEAMLHGLGGGIGFLYAVFEYRGFAPMLTMVLRSRSMPETYVANVFERVGAQRRIRETTSAAVAAKALDAALDAGTPAVCVVDTSRLPYSATPSAMSGMSPHHVAVVGRDGDRVWIDDRALTPISVDRPTLAEARAAYRQAKRRSFTVEPADAPDWRTALIAAMADTVSTMREGDPTVPASFRSNCGFAGLEKWRTLLTATHKKGWPRVFDSGPTAYAGLRRAYDCIMHEHTAPHASRPLYASFLDEAAGLLQRPSLGEVADTFRSAGEAWAALAELIASAQDERVQETCRLADARAEAIDDGDLERAAELTSRRAALGSECTLEAGAATALYARLADSLAEVITLERQGIDQLADTVESL